MDDEPNAGVKTLVFRGRLSEIDVVDMQWCLDRLMVRRSIRWLVVGFATFLAVLCLGASVLGFYTGGEGRPNLYIATAFVLIAWAYLLFVWPSERAWHARRHYRRHAAEYLETQVTLSEDWVAVENEDHRSAFRWKLVGIIADVPSGLLFCKSPRQGLFWLPARLLEGNRLREQVMELAERNGVRVQRFARWQIPPVRFTVRRLMGAVAGMALVCGGVVCGMRMAENRLAIENESGQPLAWLKIGAAYSGHIVKFRDLPDGGAETASFSIGGDEGFVVDGMLADGTKVGGNFGYVRSEAFGERPRFVLRKGGKIDFTQ